MPSSGKDAKHRRRLINARAETLAAKPEFRDAGRRRRCLIPASGFYEWKTASGRKQPFYVYPTQGKLFAFAGLYESWSGPDGALDTCAIVTTDAAATLRTLHPRMPLILDAADYALWLQGDSGEAARLLRAHEAVPIARRRVSPAVNAAREDSPRLIAPENT